MSRLWVGRCPGCGVELTMRPEPPTNDLWCSRCCDRIAAVGRTTLPGSLARAVDWLARRLDAMSIDWQLKGERVAEGILRTTGRFRGKLAD